MMNGLDKTPKVSVCVVTYNQEKYIRKCLQSIVDQKTDYDFEVIVGDDASTDGTRAIVQEFVDKYPGIVRAVLHEKNVGCTPNYFSVHNLARGEYIAHLDGDDYCLPGKLMRLSAHLDENPECAIVWHRMYILNERGQCAIGMPVVPIKNFIKSDRLYARDMAKYYGITGCHSGSMHRASAKKMRDRDAQTLDYFFTMSLCADGGYASYIDEPYGVYRFFASENTITRAKGNTIVGRLKLDLMKSFLSSHPQFAREFAAQCLVELMIRSYLRHPMKWDYFKMLLSCRAVPRLSDVILVTRIFLANRNATLERAYVDAKETPVFN